MRGGWIIPDPRDIHHRHGRSRAERRQHKVMPIEPLARYFEYWLLRLQGVYEGDAKLSREARAFLDTVRASSPFALGDVKVSRRTLGEIEAAHRELIAMHLEKDLKSVRVLRDMRR